MNLEPITNVALLVLAGVVFHAMLWLRNGRFLWSKRKIILQVVAIAELWMLVSDPIGGHMRAWIFNPDKVLGIWFFQVMPIEDFFGIAVVSSATACAVLVFGYSPRKWI